MLTEKGYWYILDSRYYAILWPVDQPTGTYIVSFEHKIMTMKKIMLATMTALLLGTFGISHAQNDGGFGLKGGVGFHSLNIDNQSFEDAKNRIKLGGLLGVSYEKRFGDGKFAMDIEALIANKGSEQRDEVKFGNNTLKYSLKTNVFTVDVPISGKFYIGDNFNILFGPYFSYIFGARLKTVVDNNGNKTTDESDDWFDEKFKDDNGNYPLNRFDAGINVGFEFVSNGGFGIGARLNQGFVDITNNNYNKVIIPGVIVLNSDQKTLNTGFQVYGLIRF